MSQYCKCNYALIYLLTYLFILFNQQGKFESYVTNGVISISCNLLVIYFNNLWFIHH